jgi:hypothetical protein
MTEITHINSSATTKRCSEMPLSVSRSRRFIGGSVSAEVEDIVECVADAVVVLYSRGEQIAETVSDAFGDFRFGGLAKESGVYRVEIAHPLGNASRECELGESVYLGDVKLGLGLTKRCAKLLMLSQ